MRNISRHNQMFTVFLVARAQIFKWKQQNNGNIKSYLKVKYVRFLV